MRPRFKVAIQDPIAIRPGDTAQNRPSDKPFETRKIKRVRFGNTEMDSVPNYASSRGRRTAADAPKTSEYAYFRNVKKGAVSGYSGSLHKENEQLIGSKDNYFRRETVSDSDMLKSSIKDLKFSVSGKREGPSNHHFFLSTPVSKNDEPDHSTNLIDNSKRRPSMLSENVTPVGRNLSFSPLDEAESSGNEFSEKGVFSEKRARLRQLVANNTLSGVENFHPKGFDLVDSLLRRLFPKNDQNDDSSKAEIGHTNKSHTFHESNHLEKRLHLSDTRERDKNFPEICWSEVEFPDHNTSLSKYSLHNDFTETHFHDEWTSFDPLPRIHINRSSHTGRDFSSRLPFERYKSSSSCHLHELDEFCFPIERTRKEPNRLLLEWDPDKVQDTVYPFISNYVAAENSCPELTTTWNDNHLQIVPKYSPTRYLTREFGKDFEDRENMQDTVYPSISNYVATENLCPGLTTTWNDNRLQIVPKYPPTPREFGKDFEDFKCELEEQDRFSLTFPCSPKGVALANDSCAENVLYNGSFICSYADHHWLKNSGDFWRKSLSGLESCREALPPLFRSFEFPKTENSLYSFSRMDEAPEEPVTESFLGSISRPLLTNYLLDSVGLDRDETEMYFDDDIEMKYR